MRRFVFVLLTMFELGFTQDKPIIFLAGLEGEINTLKQQIIKQGGTPQDFYPNKTYIDSRFPNASEEKKQKLLRKYDSADAKSGVFMGIDFGQGNLFNDYIDGYYNQTVTTIDDLKKQKTGVLKSPLNTQSNLLMFGGKAGYQSFFNPYFGARVYGDVMLSSGDIKDKKDGNKIGSLIYMLGTLNLDLLLDVPLDKKYKYFVGGYFGIGVGVMILLDNANKNKMKLLMQDGNYSSDHIFWDTLLQVDYTFNTGVSFTINRKNRIEVGAKIPWNFLRLGLESPATYHSMSGDSKTLESKDIQFKRSVIWNVSYVYVF
ncbi:outer membrane beta-barrel protein [Helicobacter sp. 13S00477-4]|uniref:outer membrane beta-barrel protein n=1 Tax=Helicobacter sp. 13S00477-4 TaxID=1905759 RepID=UPI000BA6C9E1|nr:outer membrane beta-barrel protein [Helicobacter sp. 13S00477-4]PAF51585.1 hypothetical protein BKH44_05045 [Helicobacter sp. 13S00477-4]